MSTDLDINCQISATLCPQSQGDVKASSLFLFLVIPFSFQPHFHQESMGSGLKDHLDEMHPSTWLLAHADCGIYFQQDIYASFAFILSQRLPIAPQR